MDLYSVGSSGTGAGASSDEPEGMTLLIAVDSSIQRQIYRRFCAVLYQPVVCVENGLEAVRAYEKEPGRFRSILMEVSMPIMDGRRATREIRHFEESRGIRRAAIVGLAAQSVLQSWETAPEMPPYLADGYDAVVKKPVSLKYFFEYLCGPPETNLFFQYGGLSEAEGRWYSLRCDRLFENHDTMLNIKREFDRPACRHTPSRAPLRWDLLEQMAGNRSLAFPIISFRADRYRSNVFLSNDNAEGGGGSLAISMGHCP